MSSGFIYVPVDFSSEINVVDLSLSTNIVDMIFSSVLIMKSKNRNMG
jgi:hypothetical protein